jgi:hypothetical protein
MAFGHVARLAFGAFALVSLFGGGNGGLVSGQSIARFPFVDRFGFVRKKVLARPCLLPSPQQITEDRVQIGIPRTPRAIAIVDRRQRRGQFIPRQVVKSGAGNSRRRMKKGPRFRQAVSDFPGSAPR